MDVQSDPWVRGGRSTYDIAVTGDAAKNYTGTFTGTFDIIAQRGDPVSVQPLKGKVTINFSKPFTIPEGFKQPKADEHPRLLFRKSDLEKMRAKAKTPLGAAMLERFKNSKDPVELGMAYQLTGDKEYAAKAIAPVTEKIHDELPGAFRGATGEYGHRTADIALAYDLCYDGWPVAFRNLVLAKLAYKTEKLLYNPNAITKSFNWSPNSNYAGWASGGSAISSLILYNKKTKKPTPIAKTNLEPIQMTPDANFTVGKDVPVNKWQDGLMPGKWIMLGPISNEAREMTDYVQSIGGEQKLRPEVGTAVKVGDTEMKFTSVDPTGITEGPL